MIGSNWKKSLLIAAAALVTAAAVPSTSQAQYTGMTAPIVAKGSSSVKKVSTKKTAAKSTKHKSAKKHKKLGKKHKA